MLIIATSAGPGRRRSPPDSARRVVLRRGPWLHLSCREPALGRRVLNGNPGRARPLGIRATSRSGSGCRAAPELEYLNELALFAGGGHDLQFAARIGKEQACCCRVQQIDGHFNQERSGSSRAAGWRHLRHGAMQSSCGAIVITVARAGRDSLHARHQQP